MSFSRTLAVTLILFSSTGIFAQDQKVGTPASATANVDSATTAGKNKSYFRFGVNYVNDNVYLGRKDSTAIPYLSPSLGYFSSSGFYVEADAGFLIGSPESRLDLVSIIAGYSFDIGNYSGDISASKHFYNEQSTSVKSAQKGSIDYYSYYDGSFVTPTFSAGLNFASKTDVTAALGIEHAFEVVSESLSITPGVAVNGSTQNYYNEYYKSRRFKARRKGSGLPGIQSISGVVLNAAAFKILDAEFSLPIEWKLGRFKITATPYYAIPVNPAQLEITTHLTNGSTVVKQRTEKIGNSFWGSLDVSFKF